MMPALPPGFQLQGNGPVSITVHGGADSPPPAAHPPLPPGFELVSPNATSAPPPQSIPDMLSAGFSSGVSALPFVGPSVLTVLEHFKGFVQGRPQSEVAASDQAQVEQNPVASTVGAGVGTVLPFLVGGEIPTVAKVLGMDSAMPLLSRTLLSGGTQAAITGGDELLRGADPMQAAKDAALAGGVGLVAPGAGDLIGKMAGAAGSKISRAWDTMTNPDRAAEKIVGGTMARDVQSGQHMTATDEAAAVTNSQPVINADRYGQGTRVLARTAANTDQSAEAALKNATNDRFATQNARAVDFVKRVTGGSVDDLAAQDAIRTAARQSNRAAYAKAEANPNAQALFTPEISQLFQSPTFRKAVKDATSTAAEDAAINGSRAVQNPFVFDAQDRVSMRVNPDGSKAIPNLQFWDIVQRNLRKAGEKAARVPDGLSDASQIGQLRTKLLDVLDNAVPDFAKARAGAAAAFGAEDAVDAGRKFVSQRMGIPEARRAYAQFTPAEKKAFATGFASELIDKINSVSDRVNVINQVFGSPAARAQVELALGKDAATELEHFVRIEDIMQMTKNEVGGNSTTAKQLAAMGALGGIGGGIGGMLGGWDPKNVGAGALLMMAGKTGLRSMGKAMDQKVMQRVAEMLTSSDPAMMTKATKSATWSPAFRDAVQAIERGLHSIVKGETVNGVRQPVQVTVNGGNAPTTASVP